MGSKSGAIGCVNGNKETGNRSFCRRNIMGEILRQIDNGTHFIALQDDFDIIADTVEKIKNYWNFATKSMEDFLKEYVIPLNSLKRGLDEGNRKKNWTLDVYKNLAQSVSNYKFSKDQGPSSAISSAYNKNCLVELERSSVQHFLRVDPKSGPERPFRMRVFKYDP